MHIVEYFSFGHGPVCAQMGASVFRFHVAWNIPGQFVENAKYNHHILFEVSGANFHMTRRNFHDEWVTRMLYILKNAAICSYFCLSLYNADCTLLFVPRCFDMPSAQTKEFVLCRAEECRAFNSLLHPSEPWVYESHTWLVSCEWWNMTLANFHQYPAFSLECFGCITLCSMDKSCNFWLVKGT